MADFHTYFVGDDHWGFAVWAHNLYMRAGRNDSFEVYSLGDGPQQPDFTNRLLAGDGTDRFTEAAAQAEVHRRNKQLNLGAARRAYSVLPSILDIDRIGTGYNLQPNSATSAIGGTWSAMADIVTGSTQEPPDTYNPGTPIVFNPLERHIDANVQYYAQSGKYVYVLSIPEKGLYADPQSSNSSDPRWTPPEVPGATVVERWRIMRKDQTAPDGSGAIPRMWLVRG